MHLITKLWYVFRHRKDYKIIHAESFKIAKLLLKLRTGSDGYHKLQTTTTTRAFAKRFIFWNRKTIKRFWSTSKTVHKDKTT